MQFSWNDPTAIMFAIYLLAMLAIGWLGYLGTKNLSDYILAGRSRGQCPVDDHGLTGATPPSFGQPWRDAFARGFLFLKMLVFACCVSAASY